MSARKVKKWNHPETLNVGYKVFKIVQKSLEKDNLYGCAEMSKALITIDPDQSPVDYRGTLLHEILHVGYEIFGLGDDDEMPTIGNEFLVTITSNMMQLFATQNPELFKFIFDNE
jgi:hypothetical protein